MNRFIFISILTATLSFNLSGQSAQLTVKDADGNVYGIIQIGRQIWMEENLKTTRFNDGKIIPMVPEDKKWNILKTPAYCWFNNNIANKEVYGALYNWYTVNTKKICPKDWHVPTDEEWTTMINILGDIKTAGNKLKEKGTEHWKNTLQAGTDEFFFRALPGGLRNDFGVFPEFGNSYAVWWTATEFSPTDAWNRGLFYSSSQVFKGHDKKLSGFSIRCIKDQK